MAACFPPGKAARISVCIALGQDRYLIQYLPYLRCQVEDEDPPQPEKLKLIKRKSESGKKSQAASRPLGSAGPSKQPLVESAPSEDPEEKDPIADDASFVAGLKEREESAPVSVSLCFQSLNQIPGF